MNQYTNPIPHIIRAHHRCFQQYPHMFHPSCLMNESPEFIAGMRGCAGIIRVHLCCAEEVECACESITHHIVLCVLIAASFGLVCDCVRFRTRIDDHAHFGEREELLVRLAAIECPSDIRLRRAKHDRVGVRDGVQPQCGVIEEVAVVICQCGDASLASKRLDFG
jgi:hypothetical protein